MSNPALPVAYRIILRAYPRSFRERFGPEMAQLFLDRRREGASGVGLVLDEVVDCVRVAPRLHLERPMSRAIVPVLIIATFLGVLFGGAVGLIPAFLLILVLIAFRGERPIGALTGSRWWGWFAGAAIATVVLFTVLAIDGDELTSLGWMIAFVSGNTAIALTVIGVANGLFRLVQRTRTAPAA